MLEIPIDAELERTLAAAAARAGEEPGELARKALLAYLEDLEVPGTQKFRGHNT